MKKTLLLLLLALLLSSCNTETTTSDQVNKDSENKDKVLVETIDTISAAVNTHRETIESITSFTLTYSQIAQGEEYTFSYIYTYDQISNRLSLDRTTLSEGKEQKYTPNYLFKNDNWYRFEGNNTSLEPGIESIISHPHIIGLLLDILQDNESNLDLDNQHISNHDLETLNEEYTNMSYYSGLFFNETIRGNITYDLTITFNPELKIIEEFRLDFKTEDGVDIHTLYVIYSDINLTNIDSIDSSDFLIDQVSNLRESSYPIEVNKPVISTANLQYETDVFKLIITDSANYQFLVTLTENLTLQVYSEDGYLFSVLNARENIDIIESLDPGIYYINIIPLTENVSEYTIQINSN